MSLIQSARMNGHDPYVYLKDVLTRFPTHRASRIEELLPHRWQPSEISASDGTVSVATSLMFHPSKTYERPQ